MTDDDVFDYFKKLTGQSEMPMPLHIPGKGNIYTIKTSKGNITLRDFADSSQKTGAKWTIDIPKAYTGTTHNPEIKFRVE